MVGGLPFEIRRVRYNAETETAMTEAREIAAGNIQAKSYSSVFEMLNEINSEEIEEV